MYRAFGTRNPEGWWRQRIEIRCDNINRADGSTYMMLIAYFFGLLPLVKCSPRKRRSLPQFGNNGFQSVGGTQVSRKKNRRFGRYRGAMYT